MRFELAAGGRGITVKVNIEYQPPVGKFGVVAANLLGVAPERLLKTYLSGLKQLLEAGEISSLEGQPHGFSRGKTEGIYLPQLSVLITGWLRFTRPGFRV